MNAHLTKMATTMTSATSPQKMLWQRGAGIKPAVTAGPSDPWGDKPADRRSPNQMHNIHAAILYLLGIDHRRLTVRRDGIDRRLTDVHGRVLHELLA